MIVTKTPLRISFVGGGSDQQYFYKDEPGAVVSTTINQYIYIMINKKFDHKIRASYSKTEIVDSVHDLKHGLIRESLKLVNGFDGGIEIVSVADIPGGGTGLGSSSAYAVGVLHGLHVYQDEFASAETLAQEACYVEITKTKMPIGKQDQYIAAYGGWNFIQFNSDGSVFVDPIICHQSTKMTLQSRLLMLYTGVERTSEKILIGQKYKFNDKSKKALKIMVEIAREMKTALNNNQLDSFGELLDENWQLKKSLNGEISNPQIEEWYEKAKEAGAIGGKICGAGGGGFLLLYAPQEKHSEITEKLSLKPMKIQFEPQGSKVIYKE